MGSDSPGKIDTQEFQDFILTGIELILAELETFAQSLVPGATMNKPALRDYAAEILKAMAVDMKSAQSNAQQIDKSKGLS